MKGRIPEGEREARMAWSRLTEPADQPATTLIRSLGAEAALHRAMSGRLSWTERLRPRLEALDIDQDLAILGRIGARVLVPGDEEWPSGLEALEQPPHCLWVRGPEHLAQVCQRSASVVGARMATSYGQMVALDLGDGLAERGFAIVSGAAYGIDAAAHRGALASEGATVAVLAGGVERPYPQGNAELISRIARVGLVVSEMPPGSAPTKLRFLRRNRLIATLSKGTVVVEAGLRSGSLHTARLALEHHRPVGAVPGPVTSSVSAGCHELVRTRGAELVTDAAEAAELVGEVGRDLAPVKRGEVLDTDDLSEEEAAVLSALPYRKAVSVDDLVVRTTLEGRQVLGCLGRLSLRGLATRDGDRWKKHARGGPAARLGGAP